jgi:hypothetical protein
VLDVAAAAHAVQANVVALKVAWQKKIGTDEAIRQIRTPSPGRVRQLRDILIDHRLIRQYDPDDIALRLRQVWGEFNALCWLFPFCDPQKPIQFEPLAAGQSIRCHMESQKKLDHVQSGLWRLLHEQRLRHDRDYRQEKGFRELHEQAQTIDVNVYGVAIGHCDDQAMFCCTCEYAGMLAALRWACDDRWDWEGPGIMDVALPG